MFSELFNIGKRNFFNDVLKNILLYSLDMKIININKFFFFFLNDEGENQSSMNRYSW